MPKPAQVYILRHGARLDMSSPQWIYTTATPYDPPLTTSGKAQSAATGARIATLLPNASAISDSGSSSPALSSHGDETGKLNRIASATSSISTSSDLSTSISALSLTSGLEEAKKLGNSNSSSSSSTPPAGVKVIIHTSPFLRCLQTATHVASSLPSQIKPQLRIDAWLGEWMTQDYYTDISPPPPMPAMIQTAKTALAAREIDNADAVTVDYAWDGGTGADMGEEWSAMHKRFRKGYEQMMSYYAALEPAHDAEQTVVILVTHGAGCNALLGAISKRPVLMDVGIGAMSLASLNSASDSYELDIISAVTPASTSSSAASSISASNPHKSNTSHHLSPPHHAKLHRSASTSTSAGLWSPHNHHHPTITPTLVITGGSNNKFGQCEREKERELDREREAEKERDRERELGLGFVGWGEDIGMELGGDENGAGSGKIEKQGLWRAKGWGGMEQPLMKRRWTVGREAAPPTAAGGRLES